MATLTPEQQAALDRMLVDPKLHRLLTQLRAGTRLAGTAAGWLGRDGADSSWGDFAGGAQTLTGLLQALTAITGPGEGWQKALGAGGGALQTLAGMRRLGALPTDLGNMLNFTAGGVPVLPVASTLAGVGSTALNPNLSSAAKALLSGAQVATALPGIASMALQATPSLATTMPALTTLAGPTLSAVAGAAGPILAGLTALATQPSQAQLDRFNTAKLLQRQAPDLFAHLQGATSHEDLERLIDGIRDWYLPNDRGGAKAVPEITRHPDGTVSVSGMRVDTAGLNQALNQVLARQRALIDLAQAGHPQADALLQQAVQQLEGAKQARTQAEQIFAGLGRAWGGGGGSEGGVDLGGGGDPSILPSVAAIDPSGLTPAQVAYASRTLDPKHSGALWKLVTDQGYLNQVAQGQRPGDSEGGVATGVQHEHGPMAWTLEQIAQNPMDSPGGYLASWAMARLGQKDEIRERGFADFQAKFRKAYPLTHKRQWRKYHVLARRVVDAIERRPGTEQQRVAQQLFEQIVRPVGERIDAHEVAPTWGRMARAAVVLARRYGLRLDPADIPNPAEEARERRLRNRPRPHEESAA